jgi:hypothetical protein
MLEERPYDVIVSEMRMPGMDGAELLGATHAQMGGYPLGLWNLPDGVIEAVAYHHIPGFYPLQRFGPLTAVHVANALDHGRRMHESPSGPVPQIDWGYLSAIGIAQHTEAWPLLIDDHSSSTSSQPA